MKLSFTFLFFLLCLAAHAQDTPVSQIELSKESRGGSEHIRITRDSLFFSSEDRKNGTGGKSYARSISPEQWTALVATIKNIKLTDISNLPSPSMKRASDAAMHATMTIYTSDGKTYAHGYDDENPNEILQPLRKAIRALAGTPER